MENKDTLYLCHHTDRIRRKIVKIEDQLEHAKKKYGERAGKFSNINQKNRDLNIQVMSCWLLMARTF